jgi:hypothetical protein
VPSNPDRPPRSTTRKRSPRRATELTPAGVASILTAVLYQVQVNAQGGTHNPVPVLVALVLILVTAARSERPGDLSGRTWRGPARLELRLTASRGLNVRAAVPGGQS